MINIVKITKNKIKMNIFINILTSNIYGNIFDILNFLQEKRTEKLLLNFQVY